MIPANSGAWMKMLLYALDRGCENEMNEREEVVISNVNQMHITNNCHMSNSPLCIAAKVNVTLTSSFTLHRPH